jgi:Dolichyl-phosphate-mannose-protein mannosyltransferase
MRRGGVVAIGAVAGWYAFALAILHPLANGPVADSWLYGEAARWFRATGEFRFPGYTEAMPLAQVVYGAAWGSIFGGGPASLDVACMMLAVIGGLLMYALAIRCGAREWQALAAAGLMVCNPCYLFLSFSFMSEVPFIAALLACHLAFANAEGENEIQWLWLSAIFGVVAFSVRPFGGAAILGAAGAILLYDAMLPPARQASRAKMASMLAPFAIAFVACALIWIWLTVLKPPPWKLSLRQSHFSYLLYVSFVEYTRSGLLGPILYLGIVLSPMALLRLETKDAGKVIALGAGIFSVAMILVWAGDQYPSTPEMSCFGGWSNALILRGLPSRFLWQDSWRYVVMLLGSIGAAGIIFACIDAIPKLNRASSAVLIAVAIYWAAIIPLWLFNDRYDLVIVPAGALVLALAPLPNRRMTKVAALTMTTAMGLLSLGGVYSYQRGLAAVIAARDTLQREGIPRSAIDAGYELNGLELYRFSHTSEDTLAMESGIPMVTSERIDEYTLASHPFQGTTIMGRIAYPGPFGIGKRELYILRRTDTGKPAD